MRNGVCLIILGALAVAAEAAPRTWELREGGRWQEVVAPATQPATVPQLDRVEELLQFKRHSDARRAAVRWLTQNKDHPARDRALYLLGEANYRNDDRVMAFYNFDELLDLHPGSPYGHAALQRQYDIADAYLSGYKDLFLICRIAGRQDEAIEMLFRVQQRAPGSPVAEKALLRTADYYYDSGDSDLAADAYGAYIRSYPRSPNTPRVKLKRAFAVLREFRGVRFSANPVIDARQQLLDLQAAYPELAEQENLRAVIQRLDETLATKAIETAAFYRRTHQPGAAAYWYRQVTANYPGTPQAQLAVRLLAELPPDEAAGPTTEPTK